MRNPQSFLSKDLISLEPCFREMTDGRGREEVLEMAEAELPVTIPIYSQ